MLAGVPAILTTLAGWPGLDAPEETGTTFAENARLKATYYAAVTACRQSRRIRDSKSTPWTGRPGLSRRGSAAWTARIRRSSP